MKTSIVTSTLTDGSKVYAVVFVDGSLAASMHCNDEKSADLLQTCIEACVAHGTIEPNRLACDNQIAIEHKGHPEYCAARKAEGGLPHPPGQSLPPVSDRLTLDYTKQGRRPTAAQIVAAWKNANRKPTTIIVEYGETFAEFELVGGRWYDSGNGQRGVDRTAVIKALRAELRPAEARGFNNRHED